MDLIYLGKVANTHGLKGEIKIISDFDNKEEVFKTGNKIYIANQELIINTYRKHKNYDMVTLNNKTNIDDVMQYKGLNVYFDNSNFKFSLLTDLIGMKVYYEDEYKGIVTEILKNKLYPILKIENKHVYMIPKIPYFIKKIDEENRIIKINYIKGLEYED